MDVYDFTDSDSDSSFHGFDTPDIFGANNNSDSDTLSNNGSDISISDLSDISDLSSDNDDFQVDPPEWTRDFQQADIPYFNQPCGPVYPGNFSPQTASQLEYLQLFLTDSLLQTIVDNTNKYAEKRFVEKQVDTEKYWKEPLTMVELKAFIGIAIIFGIAPLPQARLYWNKSPVFNNSSVNRTMPFKRYEKINEYLLVNDPNNEPKKGTPGYHKLYKIKPVLDCCAEKFAMYYRPGEHQSIDEGMIACKSRIDFLQYMPDKPRKRGVKLFLRCESKTGYLHQFDVYLGKRNTTARGQYGLYFDVISDLTHSLRGKNHRVYFDNLYTSIPILQLLQSHQIFACGTVRANRKFLPEPVAKATEKGKDRGWFVSFQDSKNRNLTATAWNDTKMVRFASTLSRPEIAGQCMRRSGAQTLILPRPHLAQQYGDHMGGVDICDQLRAKYKVGRFTKKNWKYILWWFVSQSIINAWILYSSSSRVVHKKEYKQLNFRHDLANQLINGFSSRKLNVFAPKPTKSSHHQNVHLGKKLGRSCYSHKKYYGKKKRTIYGCIECNVNLCKDCHIRFHQQK